MACADMGYPAGMSGTVCADRVTEDGEPNPVSGHSVIEAACEMAKVSYSKGL